MSRETHDPDALKRMQDIDRSKRADDLSKKILASLNSTGMGERTIAWLRNVSENVPLTQLGSASQPAQMSVMSIMDKLFDEFHKYSFQFNQTEANRELVTTCQRPVATGQQEQTWRGFVQNSIWVMLLQGTPTTIVASFVAPRFLYEDESRRPVVPPFLCIDSAGSGRSWMIDGKEISADQLGGIAKVMFARLLRVSRREVSETDKLEIQLEAAAPPAPVVDQAELDRISREELITECIMTLLELFEYEQQVMHQEGMKAARNSNMELMQSIMNRSSNMKDMRENAATLAKKWAAVLTN